EEDCFSKNPSRGSTLILLSIATSIDALAVGISLAMINVNIVTSSIIIGIVSTSLTILGLLLGNRLSDRFGKRMEVIGGIILILIGIRILISHTLFA
ncbi:MAG: manganese efflux pump, partial [Anaerolineaceae bacterium]|nr:manganese efflux pump [Anaerolineaceae bacterium]